MRSFIVCGWAWPLPRETALAAGALPWFVVTQVMKQWPLGCPNGHPFAYHRNIPSVGWIPCSCVQQDPRGHRTYWCLVCDAALYIPACASPDRR